MKVKKFILTLGRTYIKIHTPTMVQKGGRIDPKSFWYVAVFYLQQKAFDLLHKKRYILWVVIACDVTNNGRHLGFYQELEIR